MAEETQPLVTLDFDQIEEALTKADVIEREINKARQAGIELPGQIERVREQRVALQKLKTTYFPGR